MYAFKLSQKAIKHVLIHRKRDRIAAQVLNRTLPTEEVETGRIALLPKSALEWAQKQGLKVAPMQAFMR